MFIDSHCHLYDEYYENIDDIIKLSIDNNVCRYIDNGVDSKTNKEVIDKIIKYVNMYGTIGIHPENVSTYKKEDICYIKNLRIWKVVYMSKKTIFVVSDFREVYYERKQ